MAEQKVFGSRAVAPSVSNQSTIKALIAKKLAGAKVDSVKEWQAKWNAKNPENKIAVDGVAGRQTLSAMGAWGVPNQHGMRAQGGGEGGAPNKKAKAKAPGSSGNKSSGNSSSSNSGRAAGPAGAWGGTNNARSWNIKLPAWKRAHNPGYYGAGVHTAKKP